MKNRRIDKTYKFRVGETVEIVKSYSEVVLLEGTLGVIITNDRSTVPYEVELINCKTIDKFGTPVKTVWCTLNGLKKVKGIKNTKGYLAIDRWLKR
jgi:hypothetical protein